MIARFRAQLRGVGEVRLEQPHIGAPLLHGAAKLVHRIFARALGIADGFVCVGEDRGRHRPQRRRERRLRPQTRLVAHVHF